MRKIFVVIISMILIVTGCQNKPSDEEKGRELFASAKLNGIWIKERPGSSMQLNFKDDGTVEADFGADGSVEVSSEYSIEKGKVTFVDLDGQSCPGKGKYEILLGQNYIGFDLIEDSCAGRMRATMGFWTRPGYADMLIALDEKIEKNNEPRLLLERARMLMALGKSVEAKADFDTYIKTDSLDARVFMNRAGTRFPYDIPGVILDCNKAIALDSTDKNSYFMRGLAQYQLGNTAEACDDYSKAIELGFTFLKKAEAANCRAFWD